MFKQVVDADRPMLAGWLTRPHVTAAGWDDTLLDDLESFGTAVAPYIAYDDDQPVGYVQSYVAAAAGNGWWPDERDPGVRGIDLFLADASRLGKGLGTPASIQRLVGPGLRGLVGLCRLGRLRRLGRLVGHVAGPAPRVRTRAWITLFRLFRAVHPLSTSSARALRRRRLGSGRSAAPDELR